VISAKNRSTKDEAAVTEREQVVCVREHEADEVLSVAQAVADGDIGCAESNQAQDDAQGGEPVPDKPTLARRLFGRAVARLRQEERAAARVELTDAFDEVRRADDAIVRIANRLPMNLREQVYSARTSLTRSIMSLTSHLRSKKAAEHDEPPRE